MAAAAAAAAEFGPRAGVIAPLPPCERGVALVLSASADGQYLAYGSSTNVIIRSVENPNLAMAYGQHAAPVKAAKFAPTGKFVASGDASGKVRVWAFTHPENLLKYELPSIGGEVEDVAWDAESKRIAAVGAGALKAKVFAWDSGSQLIEVIPHMKKNLTVDFKPTRPFRVVLGGEDFQLSFYQGPPFRIDKSLKDHTNFVNCVRYSPDGARFVSTSSDRSGIVYDGTTSAVIGRLSPDAGHAGSVFACAWSPDSTRLVTAGGDKRLKLWDMTGPGLVYPCAATIAIGERLEDMQLGVVWPRPDTIVSVSLDGTLTYVSAAAGAVTSRVAGHKDLVNAIAIDPASGNIYTGDTGGRVCVWRARDEARTVFAADVVTGEVPVKRIAGVAVAGGVLAAVAWDDKLRLGDAVTGELKAVVALPGQPKGVALSAADPHTALVITSAAVVVVKGGVACAPFAAPYAPTAVDVSRDGKLVAVGGADKRVHIYSLDGATGALAQVAETREAGAAISVVAFSPDSTLLAAGDAGKEVLLFNAETGATLISNRWVYHTTRITGLAWAPGGRLLASVSTDRRLCFWSPSSEVVVKEFALAHPQPFAGVAWASDDAVWTLGADGVATRRLAPV